MPLNESDIVNLGNMLLIKTDNRVNLVTDKGDILGDTKENYIAAGCLDVDNETKLYIQIQENESINELIIYNSEFNEIQRRKIVTDRLKRLKIRNKMFNIRIEDKVIKASEQKQGIKNGCL